MQARDSEQSNNKAYGELAQQLKEIHSLINSGPLSNRKARQKKGELSGQEVRDLTPSIVLNGLNNFINLLRETAKSEIAEVPTKVIEDISPEALNKKIIDILYKIDPNGCIKDMIKAAIKRDYTSFVLGLFKEIKNLNEHIGGVVYSYEESPFTMAIKYENNDLIWLFTQNSPGLHQLDNEGRSKFFSNEAIVILAVNGLRIENAEECLEIAEKLFTTDKVNFAEDEEEASKVRGALMLAYTLIGEQGVIKAELKVKQDIAKAGTKAKQDEAKAKQERIIQLRASFVALKKWASKLLMGEREGLDQYSSENDLEYKYRFKNYVLPYLLKFQNLHHFKFMDTKQWCEIYRAFPESVIESCSKNINIETKYLTGCAYLNAANDYEALIVSELSLKQLNTILFAKDAEELAILQQTKGGVTCQNLLRDKIHGFKEAAKQYLLSALKDGNELALKKFVTEFSEDESLPANVYYAIGLRLHKRNPPSDVEALVFLEKGKALGDAEATALYYKIKCQDATFMLTIFKQADKDDPVALNVLSKISNEIIKELNIITNARNNDKNAVAELIEACKKNDALSINPMLSSHINSANNGDCGSINVLATLYLQTVNTTLLSNYLDFLFNKGHISALSEVFDKFNAKDVKMNFLNKIFKSTDKGYSSEQFAFLVKQMQYNLVIMKFNVIPKEYFSLSTIIHFLEQYVNYPYFLEAEFKQLMSNLNDLLDSLSVTTNDNATSNYNEDNIKLAVLFAKSKHYEKAASYAFHHYKRVSHNIFVLQSALFQNDKIRNEIAANDMSNFMDANLNFFCFNKNFKDLTQYAKLFMIKDKFNWFSADVFRHLFRDGQYANLNELSSLSPYCSPVGKLFYLCSALMTTRMTDQEIYDHFSQMADDHSLAKALCKITHKKTRCNKIWIEKHCSNLTNPDSIIDFIETYVTLKQKSQVKVFSKPVDQDCIQKLKQLFALQPEILLKPALLIVELEKILLNTDKTFAKPFAYIILRSCQLSLVPSNKDEYNDFGSPELRPKISKSNAM